MAGKSAQYISDPITSIVELMEEAALCAPLAKGQAMMRKWIMETDLEGASAFREMCATADAALFANELLLAQPSASGATAFDRLAKRPGRRTAEADTALAALRASRFALLEITGDLPNGDIAARDAISGETVTLYSGNFPSGLEGTPIFGRLVSLGNGLGVIAGTPTPLDEAALALATGHVAARLRGAGAGARWAEAIYTHVIRHGTLDIPGVNRPADIDSFRDAEDEAYGDEDDEEEELVILARAWAALDGRPPDEELLQRSRLLCDANAIVSAVLGVAVSLRPGFEGIKPGLERLLLVQLETVARRELAGSSTVSIERIAANLESMIAQHGLSSTVRDTFRDYCTRAKRAITRGGADDAELSRLLQRIRGLRAKTVDQGCTEQEALAAAEKVAELLDRHGLSLSETEFDAQPCDGVAVQTTRKRMAPFDTCVPTIASFFDCRVWTERPGGGATRYLFFGLRADVAAALYLYELVERAFETETALFRAGPVYADMAGERRTATTSFQTGLAGGIRTKLEAIREARSKHQSSGRDLMITKAAMVDEEIVKLGLMLVSKSIGNSNKRVLEDAYLAGAEAAERFEWTPGIGQAA